MHDEECYDSIPLVVQKTEQQKVQTVQEQTQKAGQIRCRTLSSALFHLSYSIPDTEKGMDRLPSPTSLRHCR